jgi:hypothetical protein
MANTFKKIQTVTVGSGGAASIDFTSIPQTYTDLKIVLSARGTTDSSILGEFNGVTTGYSTRFFRGNGSTAASSTSSDLRVGVLNPSSYTASVFSTSEIYIPNYTSSTQKSISVESANENNATTNYMFLAVGLSTATAAITSIKLKNDGGENFVQYTTATLYGVSNVNIGTITSSPYATGGTVTSNGQYYIHTFTSDGTFTPNQALTCDYLVVAGGGAGERTAGGGGGAGGLRSTTTATGGGGSLESALSLTATAYTVTVGAGGTGSASVAATSGSNSVFSTITSTGGGAGGAHRFNNGVAGGSGGGSGGGDDAGTPGGQTGGAGTTNQGYAGGNSTSNANRGGGGGGGAGAVGAVGGAPTGGNGGNGVAISISGTSVFYAGGGGGVGCPTALGGGVSPGGAGGTGGSGGGGTGGFGTTNAGLTSGTVNRGGGGGGGGYDGSNPLTGGNGGSGIVIVRYK